MQSLKRAYAWGAAVMLAWSAGAAGRPLVCVSIAPQAWLVKQVAGDAVEVQTLLASGANPHTFEPTVRQVKSLAAASLYLTVGMPFEASLASRAGRLNPALKVTGMDAGVAKRGAAEHEHDHAEHGHACTAGGDPHIWLSPQLMCAMASNTVAALEQLVPDQRAALQAALGRSVAGMQDVDREVRAKLQALPSRTWVVYHPSWGYFADAYGLTLQVIEEDGKSPSARHLAQVIRAAQAAGVKTVFTEPQYDKRPAQTLAAQIGARVAVIDPLREEWPALMREVSAKLAGE